MLPSLALQLASHRVTLMVNGIVVYPSCKAKTSSMPEATMGSAGKGVELSAALCGNGTPEDQQMTAGAMLPSNWLQKG
jgi:hypothetical protein